MLPLSTEEDWSVISSSSDIDDDHSTTSSHTGNEPLDLDVDRINASSRSGSYSYSDSPSNATLRLPLISSGSHGRKTELKNDTENGDIMSVTSGEETPSRGSDADDVAASDPNSSCKLFGICQFNEAIKQRSTEFYDNYAKVKLQQLNAYIANTEKEDLDVTVDGLEPLQPLPTLEPVESLLQAQLRMKVQKSLLYCVDKIQQVLEANSDNLFHLVFCYVVLLSGVAASVTYYAKSSKQEESWVGFSSLVNKYLYEEQKEVLYLFFAKKKKVNKLFKISNGLTSRSQDWYQNAAPWLNLLVRNTWRDSKILSNQIWNKVHFWETLSLDYIEKTAPKYIEKVSWFGEKTIKGGLENAKQWFDTALIETQSIAQISAIQASKYINITTNSLNIAANLSSKALNNAAEHSSNVFSEASHYSSRILSNAAQFTSHALTKFPKLPNVSDSLRNINFPPFKGLDLLTLSKRHTHTEFLSDAVKGASTVLKGANNVVQGANKVFSSFVAETHSILNS